MPSQTFSAVDGWQRFNVPKGVERVTVDLKGAGSGSTKGGRVQGQIRVKDSDVLYLLVGEQGKPASGRNGGGRAHGGGGAGGDGSPGKNGGRGGGGAAAIRLNSKDGTIKAVAGGAGGKSGDGGDGGLGGGSTGEHGSLASSSNKAGNATGGTQIQGGNGGDSGVDHGADGKDAPNNRLGRGGRGGQLPTVNSHGGGGGGGGYYPGGGGVAALIGQAPGGGGAGGSNFTGGLFTGVSSSQGGGTTGDGSIVISWVGPSPANQPPTSPSDAKVAGKVESSGMTTRSTGRVNVSAIVRDQGGGKARLVVRYAPNSRFNNTRTEKSSLVKSGDRAEVTLTGLSQNTHYHLRLFSEDHNGKLSENYNAVDFWTNRDPTEPKLQSPSENGTVLDTDTVTFDWSFQDPDDGDGQAAFEIRWRRARDGSTPAAAWKTTRVNTGFDNYAVDPGTFKPGYYYDWTVRTKDDQGAWGPFAAPRSFYVLGNTSPPLLLYPIKDQGVDATVSQTLRWKFKDPTSGTVQTKADYRWRIFGTEEWSTIGGDTTTPGGAQTWEVEPDTFTPGVRYEWAMRTYNASDPLGSDWSEAATFWAHGGLGFAAGADTFVTDSVGSLGCGTHRVFVYARGGQVRYGEIAPLVSVNWYRKRDDIGGAIVTTNGFGADCGDLLRSIHTWTHELVIYRDGVRVMEGPVTLIEDSVDGFKIEIKDVMGYVYRRIMRQGYNDSFHTVQGIEEGLLTVVQRAGLILADALARNDPNVLPYVTLLTYPDDARQSRVVADFAKTAWEEIDDMAANAGLDYCTVGRRIILNDTHRPVGRLGEWRSDYFDAAPVISEYGMLLADYYAVTNNAGLWGAVEHADSPYGGVELLVSSFSETGADETLTKAQQEAARQVLVEQARRGIASRYPAPYVVRVPDNSQLLPHVPVDINQLVPGVWVPLRAQGTAVEIAQWQKLDQVNVVESEGNEQVQVTMSPAPNAGEDPDADNAAAEAEA